MYYCFCARRPVQSALTQRCALCHECADASQGPADPHCDVCAACVPFSEHGGCEGCGAGGMFANPRREGKMRPLSVVMDELMDGGGGMYGGYSSSEEDDESNGVSEESLGIPSISQIFTFEVK